MGLRPTQGDEKRALFSNYCCWKRRPPLCHLDRRSEGAEWRDLRFQRTFAGNVFRPEESWAFGPPKAMKNGSCSATTLNGSAALSFVISTGAPKERSGEICGVSGPFLGMFSDMAMKNGSYSATTLNGGAALPFVISTGEVMGLRPTQGDEKRVLFSNHTPALSFVISTGGVMGQRPTQGDEKRVLFSNYCCWKRRPPLCHLDRSSEGA